MTPGGMTGGEDVSGKGWPQVRRTSLDRTFEAEQSAEEGKRGRETRDSEIARLVTRRTWSVRHGGPLKETKSQGEGWTAQEAVVQAAAAHSGNRRGAGVPGTLFQCFTPHERGQQDPSPREGCDLMTRASYSWVLAGAWGTSLQSVWLHDSSRDHSW